MLLNDKVAPISKKVKKLIGRMRTRFFTLLSQKETREGRRIRINEIAAETGVAPSTISRWMKNAVTKFDAPVVEAFCAYLDCDVGDLLYIEPTAAGDAIGEN
ncbi:MAG: helix-turn-helix transcriptional regulator [bacterium]|nr:helix-turn-helix transcriptional regulator [bacterium]